MEARASSGSRGSLQCSAVQRSALQCRAVRGVEGHHEHDPVDGGVRPEVLEAGEQGRLDRGPAQPVGVASPSLELGHLTSRTSIPVSSAARALLAT
jgi:hypothetical protein